jgi:hypothetical protein
MVTGFLPKSGFLPTIETYLCTRQLLKAITYDSEAWIGPLSKNGLRFRNFADSTGKRRALNSQSPAGFFKTGRATSLAQ